MKLRSTPDRQQGAMLLEALIGILIFSLGILGLVGMQAASISNVTESKFRTDAAFLANQIIGEMWVNRTNLASYAYTAGTAPSVLADWMTTVKNTLPDTENYPPQIVIGAGGQVTVTMRWKTPKATAPRSYVATAYIIDP